MLICITLFSSPVSAYTRCITFLSKNGTLEVQENEKYKDSDLETYLDHMVSEYGIERPKTIIEMWWYADGFGKDKKRYPRIKVVIEEIYFQNGIFYTSRGGDQAAGAMWRIAEVVGGKANYDCIIDNE